MEGNIIMAYVLGFLAGTMILFLGAMVSEKYLRNKWFTKLLKKININNTKT